MGRAGGFVPSQARAAVAGAVADREGPVTGAIEGPARVLLPRVGLRRRARENAQDPAAVWVFTLVSARSRGRGSGSPRACATPRPCRAAQGMLWVWGEGPRAAAAASGGGKRSKKMGRPSSGFSSSSDRGSENEGGGAFEEPAGAGRGGGGTPSLACSARAEETEPIYAPRHLRRRRRRAPRTRLRCFLRAVRETERKLEPSKKSS